MHYIRSTFAFFVAALLSAIIWQATHVYLFDGAGEYFQVLPDGNWQSFEVAVIASLLFTSLGAIVFGIATAILEWRRPRYAIPPLLTVITAGVLFSIAWNAILLLLAPVFLWLSLVLLPILASHAVKFLYSSQDPIHG